MIIRFADQPLFRSSSFGAARTLRLLLVLGAMWLSLGHLSAQVVQIPTSGVGGGIVGEGGGTQVGRWRLPIQISVSVSGGYDDNASGDATHPQGSAFVGASVNLSYDFGTLRTHASLRTGTGFTYSPGRSGDPYDPNLYLDLSVNHQVSLRMTIMANISLRYAAEPDFSSNLTLNRRVGNYFSTSDGLSLSYQWLPRFSTVTSYSISSVLYDDRAVADASNRIDQSFSLSLRYLYLPVTTLVLQYTFSASLYQGGGGRDSYTQAVLVGFDHTFSAKLQGNVRVGAEFRQTNSAALQNNDGLNPHVEAGLSYVLTGKTTLSWNASYATEESTGLIPSASLTLSTGLVATHTFTPRINANLSCYYRHNDNGGVSIAPGIDTSFNDDSLDVTLGVNYIINRFFTANVGYSYTDVMSGAPDSSYSRNRYFAGLSVNF